MNCCRLSRDLVFRCCRRRRQGMSFLILKAIRSWATAGLNICSAMRLPAPMVDSLTLAIGSFRERTRKQAFERFVDFVIARLKQFPDLHIYHFAPYEPSALKRLMGRYATREEELDRLLRSKLFVDLYSVVRHGLRASVESYSIKRLEALYGFSRSVSLPDANSALAKVQAGLELGDLDFIGGEDRAVVEGYNRDDCLSTAALRDWLEAQRTQLISARRRRSPGQHLRAARQARRSAPGRRGSTRLIARLTVDVPADSLSGRRSNRRAGCWRIFWIGTGGKRKRSGGSISGSRILPPTSCSTKSGYRRAGIHRYDRVERNERRSPLSFSAARDGIARR